MLILTNSPAHEEHTTSIQTHWLWAVESGTARNRNLVKSTTTIDSLLGITLPSRILPQRHTGKSTRWHTYDRTIYSAQCVRAKDWKQPKRPQRRNWLNKQQNILTTECQWEWERSPQTAMDWAPGHTPTVCTYNMCMYISVYVCVHVCIDVYIHTHILFKKMLPGWEKESKRKLSWRGTRPLQRQLVS